MSAKLSVIIPTLDAAGTLVSCLARLGAADEIVVVDGGSSDESRRIARQHGARLLTSPRGRGVQLRAGAEAAAGDWLLFLHADTLLGAGWIEATERHMSDAPDAAGHFRFRLQSNAWQARLIEAGVRLRASLLRLPYGDQALLIPREHYERLGGFKPLPLFEDVDLVRRLGRARLRLLQADAITSAARWEQDGWLARSARNLACLALYLAGTSPARIARLYGRWTRAARQGAERRRERVGDRRVGRFGPVRPARGRGRRVDRRGHPLGASFGSHPPRALPASPSCSCRGTGGATVCRRARSMRERTSMRSSAPAADLLAISAVGSLREEIAPGAFVVVDQFIDRTRREHSFFGTGSSRMSRWPSRSAARLSELAAQAVRASEPRWSAAALYVAIEGPQFSTRAESELYRQWGCDVIGMTAMPEAKLAREAELPYALVGMVTDFDCWRGAAEADVPAMLAQLTANARSLQRG